jgi:uncharacterized protein YndB with AHSA1/START domain
MLINILIVIAALVIVFVVVAALQPTRFRVARTALMSAPAAAVFEQVNNLHKWEAWSPYEKRDPSMKKTYDGPPAGTGASYTWSGNNQVGEGRSTITESRPNELVRLGLEFKRPFVATNTAEFTFVPQGQGEQTAVTWSLTGDRNFMFKAMGLIMNMDKMIGGDFEKGLARLKSVVESTPAAAHVGRTS